MGMRARAACREGTCHRVRVGVGVKVGVRGKVKVGVKVKLKGRGRVVSWPPCTVREHARHP